MTRNYIISRFFWLNIFRILYHAYVTSCNAATGSRTEQNTKVDTTASKEPVSNGSFSATPPIPVNVTPFFRALVAAISRSNDLPYNAGSTPTGRGGRKRVGGRGGGGGGSHVVHAMVVSRTLTTRPDGILLYAELFLRERSPEMTNRPLLLCCRCLSQKRLFLWYRQQQTFARSGRFLTIISMYAS